MSVFHCSVPLVNLVNLLHALITSTSRRLLGTLKTKKQPTKRSYGMHSSKAMRKCYSTFYQLPLFIHHVPLVVTFDPVI